MSVKVLSAEFLTSAAEPRGFPEPGPPEIALAGRSNVGKSSAINALTQRKKLAITSRTPGRTRLVNFFDVRLASGRTELPLRLVDLPGYGFAQASQGEREEWRGRVEAYLTARPVLRGVVHLLDIRHEPSDLDLDLSEWLRSIGVQERVVLTKSDKLTRNERLGAARRIEKSLGLAEGDARVFSAEEGIGVEELRSEIAARCR